MYQCLRGEYDDVMGLGGGLKEGKDVISNGEILILRLLLYSFDLK